MLAHIGSMRKLGMDAIYFVGYVFHVSVSEVSE